MTNYKDQARDGTPHQQIFPIKARFLRVVGTTRSGGSCYRSVASSCRHDVFRMALEGTRDFCEEVDRCLKRRKLNPEVAVAGAPIAAARVAAPRTAAAPAAASRKRKLDRRSYYIQNQIDLGEKAIEFREEFRSERGHTKGWMKEFVFYDQDCTPKDVDFTEHKAKTRAAVHACEGDTREARPRQRCLLLL